MGDELEKKEPAPTNQAAEHQNPQPANMAVPTPPSGVQYTQNNLILTPIAALPNLPHDIQKDVVANVDKSDERNFQYFLKTLDNQEAENKRMHESETRNAGFRHGIVIMTGSFIMIISVLLVYKEKYEMLMELMKILIPFILEEWEVTVTADTKGRVMISAMNKSKNLNKYSMKYPFREPTAPQGEPI